MMNAYKKFGYYYDELMAEMDYDLWMEFIENYLKKGDTILDLACGTGTLCNMMYLKGYKPEGLDLSETIIEIANEKRKVNHMNIDYHVMDMSDFHTGKTYDMITCFFDSVNFLQDKKHIDAMLNCVVAHLKTGGYFICDIFSKTLMKEYEHHEMHEDYDTFRIDWSTRKTAPGALRHSITITEAGDTPWTETYNEYSYEIKDISHKNLKLIRVSGDFNDDLEEEDERILLVFQKTE